MRLSLFGNIVGGDSILGTLTVSQSARMDDTDWKAFPMGQSCVLMTREEYDWMLVQMRKPAASG